MSVTRHWAGCDPCCHSDPSIWDIPRKSLSRGGNQERDACRGVSCPAPAPHEVSPVAFLPCSLHSRLGPPRPRRRTVGIPAGLLLKAITQGTAAVTFRGPGSHAALCPLSHLPRPPCSGHLGPLPSPTLRQGVSPVLARDTINTGTSRAWRGRTAPLEYRPV